MLRLHDLDDILVTGLHTSHGCEGNDHDEADNLTAQYRDHTELYLGILNCDSHVDQL